MDWVGRDGRLDTFTLPGTVRINSGIVNLARLERRIRHQIEIARAYSAWNRHDEALTILLDAEQDAPEHIRHHFISRQLVICWIRHQRGKPSHHLADLAKRLHVS